MADAKKTHHEKIILTLTGDRFTPAAVKQLNSNIELLLLGGSIAKPVAKPEWAGGCKYETSTKTNSDGSTETHTVCTCTVSG